MALGCGKCIENITPLFAQIASGAPFCSVVSLHTYLCISQCLQRVGEAFLRYNDMKPFEIPQGKHSSHTFMHTHRHIVAVPLFALLLVSVLSMGQGMSFTGAVQELYEKVDAGKEDRVITLPNSEVRVLVFKGAQFELWNGRAVLQEGSVLAGSRGLTEVTAGAATVKGIRGAFHLTYKNGALTVAAITTPVSVRLGAQSIAVPVGYQWRSGTEELSGREGGWNRWLTDREPLLLPRTFVRTMIDKWAGLPSADGALKAGDSGSFWATPWQFAAAQERAFARWSSDVLTNLGVLSRTGDAAGLEAMLMRSDVQMVMEQTENPSALAATLLGETEVPAVRSQVMPLLHTDSDAVMVASLHPELRTAAWTYTSAVRADVDSDLLRLMVLPLTDTGEEPISDVLLTQWEEEFQNAVGQLKDDKGAFLAAYLPMIAKVSHAFAKTGYPERAQHYRDFLLSMGRAYGNALPPETHMLLNALAHQDIADVALPTVERSVDVSDVLVLKKPEPIAPEVAERLRADARQKLAQAGAVFSTQTGFTPVTKTTVKVTDIIFATKTQDRNMTFFFDLEKDEISNVVTGGKVLPYPLSYEQFIRWARGL